MSAGQVLRYVNHALDFHIDPTITDVIDAAQREDLPTEKIQKMLDGKYEGQTKDPVLMNALA